MSLVCHIFSQCWIFKKIFDVRYSTFIITNQWNARNLNKDRNVSILEWHMPQVLAIVATLAITLDWCLSTMKVLLCTLTHKTDTWM